MLAVRASLRDGSRQETVAASMMVTRKPREAREEPCRDETKGEAGLDRDGKDGAEEVEEDEAM